MGDEGVGGHIIDNLLKVPIPVNVTVLDCGCDLLSLSSYPNKPQKVILIDAVRTGGKPGEIYRFDYDQLKHTGAQLGSAHQIPTVGALELLKHLCPNFADSEIIIVGIEPKAIKLGTSLSQEVKGSIDGAIKLVFDEISSQSSS